MDQSASFVNGVGSSRFLLCSAVMPPAATAVPYSRLLLLLLLEGVRLGRVWRDDNVSDQQEGGGGGSGPLPSSPHGMVRTPGMVCDCCVRSMSQ